MKPIVVAIIDDDQLHHLHVKFRLSTLYPDAKTITFLNGQDGLDFLLANASDEMSLPDCIFLDIEMPVMNGWQFLKRFKKDRSGFKKNIDVYIFSSLPGVEEKLADYSFLRGCLKKPFDKEQLDAVLHGLTEN